MTQPLISVLVPTYNYRGYLAGAIDSVLGQTYPNVEVVVTDDGSTDGTAEMIAERYAGEPRVRWFENERNLGIVGNFNRALSHARGTYVHWLPADDWLLPAHLARMHAVLVSDPDVDVVYSRVFFADARGRIQSVKAQDNMLEADYVDARDELPEILGGVPPLAISATLFRRAAFDELGPLDASLSVLFDWEIFARFAAAGRRFAFVSDASACVRLHETSASGLSFNERGGMLEQGLRVIEKYAGDPARRSLGGRADLVLARLDNLHYVDHERLARSGLAPDFEERFAAVRARIEAAGNAPAAAAVRERLVSVVLPAIGPFEPIMRAIDSVAAQRFPHWQLVVVDQAPFAVREALRAHPAWERIAYLRTGLRTPGAARNLGVRIARGDLIAFLDDDNTLAPEHLALLVGALEAADPDADVAVAGSRLIVERLSRSGVPVELQVVDDVFRRPSDPPELGAVANALPLNALLLDRRVFARAGRFNAHAAVLEDFDYVSRLQSVARLCFSGVATLDVHVRLNLEGQTLGRCAATHYLPTLDAIYAAREVDAPLAAIRREHRAHVAGALENLRSAIATPAGLAQLVRTLAGRDLSWTR